LRKNTCVALCYVALQNAENQQKIKSHDIVYVFVGSAADQSVTI